MSTILRRTLITRLWDRFLFWSNMDLASNIGAVSGDAQHLTNMAVRALWYPHKRGTVSIDGVQHASLIAERNMVWREAAALLLDGWEPGDKVTLRGGQ